MARRTLLLIASILTAALGTALIWLYVQGADTRAEVGADLVPAVFVTAPLEAGATLTSSALTTKSVPQTVAAGAVPDPQAVVGQKLSVGVVPGQILLRSMLNGAATSRFSQGSGAASISIDDPDRVPADLRPGDTVAVYATGRSGLKLVVPSVTVRSIGSALQQSATSGGTATAPAGATGQVAVTIVGFDADPEQAVDLYGIEASGDKPVIYILGPGTKAKSAG